MMIEHLSLQIALEIERQMAFMPKVLEFEQSREGLLYIGRVDTCEAHCSPRVVYDSKFFYLPDNLESRLKQNYEWVLYFTIFQSLFLLKFVSNTFIMFFIFLKIPDILYKKK